MLPVGSSRDTNAVTTNREGFVATALTGMIPLCEDWLTQWGLELAGVAGLGVSGADM